MLSFYPFLFLSLLSPVLLPLAQKPASQPVIARNTFRNPLKQDGADPCLTFHAGWYYLSTTTATDIRIRRAKRLAELKDAPDQVVWKDDHPERFRDLWAAEFHRLDGGKGPRWYMYYTASDGKEGDTHHRMFVLESEGDDPRGPYTFQAKLKTDPDDTQYAIDGTVLKLPSGELYFLWCGRPSPTGQGLYISRMTNPWTLVGERTYLPSNGFGCPYVREAPVTLQKGNQIHLIYSACGADTPDYKLGRLTATVGTNLLSPASWKQHPRPVFARVDQYGIFGPGHNFFFRSPDGKEDWIVYHAKRGMALTYGDRSTHAKRFTWNPDDSPNFGLPVAVDTEIPAPSGEPPMNGNR
jgi:GH43 family beta-xylosidase